MSKKKVLFYGPYSAPVTGQSAAFSLVYDNFFDADKILIDTTKYYNFRILNTIAVLLTIIKIALFQNTKVIYFTCSRSIRGFGKDFFLLLFFRWSGVTVINHLHGADFYDFYYNSSVLSKIIHWSYNAIDTHIVLLEKMKEQLSMFPNADIRVVCNCYGKSFNDVTFKKFNNKRITYFSNIMESKGIMDFLAVAEIILAQDKELEIAISGLPLADEYSSKKRIEKRFKNKLEELIHKFGNRVVYHGLIEGEEKVELLLNTSIFVLPTYYKSEAVPISVIEAMRAGSAVVVTDHNYLSEFISEKNGLLVPSKQHEELLRAILVLCDNKELLKSIRMYNFELSKQLYSSENYISTIRKIINFT